MTGDILLVLATVCDSFFASLSYGSGRIKIPLSSALIISAVTTAVLTFSVLVSELAGSFIPEKTCVITGSVLLMIIGALSLFRNALKAFLKRRSGKRKLTFRLFDFGFVVSVYLDETKADADSSKLLSARESLALALALSADSVSAGLSAGFSGVSALRVCIMSMAACMSAIFLGSTIGRKLSGKLDVPWLSGVFLIILALSKLLY